MKVYLIGWGLIAMAMLVSLTTKAGQEAEIETYGIWILYTVGLVLVATTRKYKIFENIS
ncbi:MAG: hypothetical protein V7688_04500 [Alcanivorax jadensis]|jgi:hypothetical protein|uniref:hypothetical protein n=1 Tax=Alcanivorax TaxID=59753 RepID=UPI0019977801|nr:hypothetical protein [Alcanivorax sp.]MBD3642647.1 hypothetical protein [Alcanivorax sp.]